jgi:hypothetical protein
MARVSVSSSSRCVGRWRYVPRGCFTTRHARRSLMPCACRGCSPHSAVVQGLEVSRGDVLQHQLLQAQLRDTRLRTCSCHVTRNLGPHRESLVLVGGLTPRYLVPERPPVVPQHAGTLDIDIVIDLVILEDTEAYRTLEENLKKIGFELTSVKLAAFCSL